MRISKHLIQELEANIHLISKYDESEIIRILKYLEDKYFNSQPLVSDNIYDLLREKAMLLYPSNKHFKNVGFKVPKVKNEKINFDDKTVQGKNNTSLNNQVKKEKVRLPYWMGSIDKIKMDGNKTTLENFKSKGENHGNYFITDKIDGVSALIVIKDNNIKMYTRGDGKYGQDVTYLIEYINGLSLELSNIIKHIHFDEIVIRGELIISKDDFKRVSDQGANARNMVSGIVNSKVINTSLSRYVQFVAYTIIKPQLKPSDQFKLFENHIRMVYNTTIPDISFDLLSKILVSRRSDSVYEIDGIVVTHDNINELEEGRNPTYAFAFKNISTLDTTEVVVTNVNWNISKDGYIKPTIEFDPVQLSGVTIRKTTGFNGEYISTNKIGPGSRLVITRSGDVIPYIVKILSTSSNGLPQFPTDIHFKWNETSKDIITVENSFEQDFKVLENFFTKIKIAGLNTGTLKKFYNNGFTTATQVFSMTKIEISNIIGVILAEKIFNEKQKVLQNIDCILLMDATNLIGRGFGEKRLRLIADKLPNIVNGYVPNEKELIAIEGISNKTALQFIDGIKKYNAYISTTILTCNKGSRDNKKEVTIKETKDTTRFKGQQVLFSGFRNKELSDFIESNGGIVANSMTKKITLLVVSDESDNSTKIEKAKQYGIEIIKRSDFEKSTKSHV